MAIMAVALHAALVAAHVPDDLARDAAMEVAGIDQRMTGLDGRLERMDAKLDGISSQMSNNNRITGMLAGLIGVLVTVMPATLGSVAWIASRLHILHG